MRLTFVDAGVLIAAARGGSEQAARAMEILDDPDREFAASPFLRLEVLPQATFNKRTAEAAA
jgi:predicted nucleic acid-binding protein